MERALWSVVLVGVPVAIVATKTRLALAGRWRLRAAWLRGVWARLTTATVLLIVGLLAITGLVVVTAIARLAAEREREIG